MLKPPIIAPAPRSGQPTQPTTRDIALIMRRAFRGRRKRWLAGLVCGALFTCSVPSFGQATPDDLARRHFESGAAYLEESDYANALQAFEKAFELSKRPAILINLATVQERMGNLKAAIAALDKYLELAPEGEHRGTVELRRANLQTRLDESAPAVEPPPAPQVKPKAAPVAAPKPTPKPTPPRPMPPPQDELNVPAWILLGLGGLSAGGAVVTGVLAQGEYNDAKASCGPRCPEDETSTGRTLALTSTVLTGVAVVGLGVGLTLLLSDSSPPVNAASSGKPRGSVAALRPSSFPQVFIGGDTSGAAVDARWRF